MYLYEHDAIKILSDGKRITLPIENKMFLLDNRAPLSKRESTAVSFLIFQYGYGVELMRSVGKGDPW